MNRLTTFAVWGLLILVFVVAFQVVNSRAQVAPQIGHAAADVRHSLAARTPQSNDASDLGWMWIVVLAVFLLAFIYFLRRRLSGTIKPGNILELRKSRARLVTGPAKVTFADVGGCLEAKETLADLVDFLKNPRTWTSVGARLPRGVLLEGPPGCGKTLLARAVAGETNARFHEVSASEFVEMFVGVGAARVRDMFETACKNAPSVVFVDELDAVGRRRGSGIGTGHDEREQTLNQLLVSLDGFTPNDRVVVIAATNRADILDPALIRPGRFDRRIRIGELTREDRLAVLRVHTRGKPLACELSLQTIADQTDGMNGSQLEGLTNEAALCAIRRARRESNGAPLLTQGDFTNALRPSRESPTTFDKLDAVLIESATQLAEPTGRAIVRLVLDDELVVEGRVVWVNSAFIKVRGTADDAEVIVPKNQVRTIHRLAGTESASREELVPDPLGRTAAGRVVKNHGSARFFCAAAGAAMSSEFWFLSRLLIYIPLLLSLSVHEWAHAFAAAWLGDDTARLQGRMSVNPLVHIDPVGTLLLPLFGLPIGWAKPVPFNPVRFRRRISMPVGTMIVAAAGPVSNLCIAVMSLVALSFIVPLHEPAAFAVRSLLETLVPMNLMLTMFNLLPIPPLDGSHVVACLLPERFRSIWRSFAGMGPLLLLAVVVLVAAVGSNLFDGPLAWIDRLIAQFAR